MVLSNIGLTQLCYIYFSQGHVTGDVMSNMKDKLAKKPANQVV